MVRRAFPIVVTLLAVAAVAAAVWWSRRDHADEPASRPRTVVLITIDTLRADALPIYGNPRLELPAIASLVPGATVFEEAISPSPWTRPAVMSLMTGLVPSAHGNTHGEIEKQAPLPRGMKTLAQSMTDAGYRTAAFGYNPFLSLTPDFRAGFRDYVFKPGKVGDEGHVPADKVTGWVTDETLEWLDGVGDEPIFVWVHYYDPHLPYHPARASLHDADFNYRWTVPRDDEEFVSFTAQFNNSLANFMNATRGSWLAEGRGETVDPVLVEFREKGRETLRGLSPLIRSFYEAEVREVDAGLARVFDRLREMGRLDDALIALTSDHGEELFDHGDFEHGHSLHREVVRVPLLLRGPGVSARRVRERVVTTSLFPTLLDLCGIDVAAPQRMAPALLGPRAGERWPEAPPHVFCESMLYGPPRIACYLDGTDFKYERRLDDGTETLYRVTGGAAEIDSVADAHPDVCAKGRKAIEEYERWGAALRARFGTDGAQIITRDDAARKLLRAHGYIK